ncbi:musculoskeletal embryonic nuclear protein 1a [Hypomesus transpacificus]|uniref:musculoskeletal embryonic nuclear protein 1a n=1 Tax=Hypomesus transpacificus TaxID=137520 RepID=UPI001F07AF96|nr:musculoskeletal embryonic nuclear protein 1a [Hypomesus transpacificus]
MSQPDEGEQSRPEVREEDLVEAKDKLGLKGEVKSKTFEVMEECERVGKAAPSVFSGARSGAETAFNKPPTRPIRK